MDNMSTTTVEQQSLTDFFSAKKTSRPTTKQATQALELLKKLDSDLEEIRAKKVRRSSTNLKEGSPAFQRYADLLQPKANITSESETPNEIEKKNKEPFNSDATISGVKNVSSKNGKSALARLEAKRAALKAAKEKLHHYRKDQAKLIEFQATKPVSEIQATAVPAYEKYHYLTAPLGELPLPLHYQRLLDSFGACDTIVSMCHNRKEICRFDKLSTAVRSMTRHDFGLSHIGKILHIKPEAYHVSIEKHRFLDTTKKMHYILSFQNPPVGQNPKFVLDRKSDFKERLLLRVAQYHQEFLDTEMPGSNVPVEAIKRWHPKFVLDSIPDVPEKELPKLEETGQTANAQDVLGKVRGKFSARIEEALVSLAEKQALEKKDETTSADSPSKAKSVIGVNQSLLDRIRKKEALKMAEKMVMGGQDEKERRILESLPGLIRTVRQVFVSSKKATLLYKDLTAKIRDSGSFDDLDALMTRIGEIAPEWYKPLIVRNAKYVKIDSNRNVNTLCERVQCMIKNLGSVKVD